MEREHSHNPIEKLEAHALLGHMRARLNLSRREAKKLRRGRVLLTAVRNSSRAYEVSFCDPVEGTLSEGLYNMAMEARKVLQSEATPVRPPYNQD